MNLIDVDAQVSADPVVSGADRFAPVDPHRFDRIKAAYTTRFVSRLLAEDREGYGLLSGGAVTPRPGDVVVASVEKVGQHKSIELPTGRKATLYRGDEVLVAYGHRYAPDQFEAEVPSDLGPAHLVAAGGVASRMLSSHNNIGTPTQIRPLGLLADAHGVVTLARCAPYAAAPQADPITRTGGGPLVVGVVGTSMNSGKTTTAAAIVRGLSAAGYRVAAAKVTGTGAGGDPNQFIDSGAVRVLDFTDCGYASTYLLPHETVLALFHGILAELASANADAIVVEVADGLFQRETARLIADPAFTATMDHVVFAASDALGALAGRSALASRGIQVTAVSGILTASPLATLEARAALDVPVISIDELASPQVTASLPWRTSAARGTQV